MAAHQAPLSLGFSRQEHWSGLPFPSPMHDSEKSKWSHSVVSDPQWPHGLQLSRLLHPWDFPGKSTGVGCHCLLHHGIPLVGIHRYYWNIIPNFSMFKPLCFIVVFRCSVMTNSLWHYELHPTRLLCPWNYPGKNTGVGCYALLREIFLTQWSNPHLLSLLIWQVDSLPLVPPGKPRY